ncbi:hypothetical protein RRW91_07895 [Klebsiella grimontii]|uniref:hypothetical protein n=1 Tax=Klebsiella grimontii TaxID=2058152 RepID=UPI0028D9A7CD|nr:hypothetical protein [Klebsiella grimontii]MDT8622997.1 hypothetical protein [Klebsiella grimontii]
MTITLQAVNELIASLESAGELSIREQKFLELAKAYQQLAAENVALKSFGETLFEMHNALNGEGTGIQGRAEVACQQFALEAAMEEFDAIETPATDRIVAGIKADGVDALLAALENHETFWAMREMELGSLSPEAAMVRDVGLRAIEKAKQLREGAK